MIIRRHYRNLMLLSFLMLMPGLSAQETIEYYSNDFSEGLAADMQTYDLDGQTLHYTMIQSGFKQGDAWIGKKETMNANRYAASACKYKEVEGEKLMPSDDWLILPQIWVRADDAELCWKGMSINSKTTDAAAYKVMISSNGCRPEDFVESPAFEISEEMVNEWTDHRISLKNYTGKRIYIAFVNNSSKGEILGIDDVQVKGSKGVCDISIDVDRYLYGATEMNVEGVLTACSDVEISDVVLHCIAGEQELTAEYKNLSLSKGEYLKYRFDTPITLDYGTEVICKVWAEINGSTKTDAEVCKVMPLLFNAHRNIVVEEATGMWCSYCPAGALAMEVLEQKYPDSFIGLALHYDDMLSVNDYVNDLSFPDGFPTGWINRKHYCRPMVETEHDGKVIYTTLEGGFETYFIEELQTPTIAELNLTSSKPIGKSIDLNLEMRFAANIDHADMQVAYAIIENNVSDPTYFQVNGYSGKNVEIGGYEDMPGIIYDLKFQHVVRGIFDDWQGVKESVPTTIIAGESYSHQYAMTLPQTVKNINDVEIICMLIDIPTGEIINAATKSATANIEESIADNIYCRYSAGEIIINQQDYAEINIYDSAGRRLMQVWATNGRADVAGLLPGLYFAKINCGGNSQTLKFAVQ